MANTLGGINLGSQYVHCPNCDNLDRQFGKNLDCSENSIWYCVACGEANKPHKFKKAEASDKWIAQKIGTEISIVQMKDFHGRISCGWFGDSKVLIAEAQAYSQSSEISPVLDQLFKIAGIEAEKRNRT